MSRTDLWNRAATAMRDDPDPRWHPVADWLRSEALLQEGMEPFSTLVEAAFEQASGVKGYIKLGRKPDGDIQMIADTNEGATAVAVAYLNESHKETS